MPKNEWGNTTRKLYGYPSLKHKTTSEYCSFGTFGEAWPIDSGIGVRVLFPNIARKLEKLFGISPLPMKQGDERTLIFKGLPKYSIISILEILEISPWTSVQLEWANE